MTDAVVVLISAPDAEVAAALARALVTEGLAAGVNIVPGVRSLYQWQGALRDEPEHLLLAQTRADRFDALAARVAALHPYEVPQIIALPITAGHRPFLGWIDQHSLPEHDAPGDP